MASAGKEPRAAELLARLENLPMSRWHVQFYIIIMLALITDNADNGIQAAINAILVKEWHITVLDVGIIGSASAFGALVGAALFGWMGDVLGRRAAFAYGALCFSLLTGAAALAQDLNQLIAARALAGLGIGGVYPVGQAYITEYIPSGWRGKFLAWAHISVSFSGFLASLIGIAITVPLGWRAAYVVGAIPCILGILSFTNLVPESARYLVHKGKLKEAEETIDRVERYVRHGRIEPLPKDTAAVEAPKPPLKPVSLLQGFRIMLQPRYRTGALTLIPMNILPFMFTVTAFNPVLLPGKIGVSLSEYLAAAAVSSFASMGGNFVSGFLTDGLGRKKTLMLAMIPAALGPFLLYNWASNIPTVALCLIIGSAGSEAYTSAKMAYTPEALPAAVRGTGLGLTWSLFRASTIVAPLFVGAMVTFTGGVQPVLVCNVIAATLLIGIIGIWGQERRGSLGEETELAAAPELVDAAAEPALS